MQVYKAFFRIIKKNLNQIIIYIGVFLTFAIILANVSTNPANQNFEETKINIAFINNDEDSKVIEGFRDYISDNSNIVDIDNNSEQLKDALFFRKIEYIITVPEGFTDGIINGDKDITVERSRVPDSTSGIYMDSIVNKYLNTAKRYVNTINNLSQDKLVDYVSKDLSETTDVEVSYYNPEYKKSEKCSMYFNYLAYSTFAILILGVSSVMIVFNNKDLKMRNLSSALTLKDMNFQMILGNITYALIIWVIMVSASFVMYGKYMFTVNGGLFLLNSFVFTIAALSISFLIGNVINSRNAMSAVANVISLGFCFISGVFVPQELLGKTVLSIVSFNPTYWYVKANREIASLVSFSNENLAPIFTSMLIVLGFALAIFAVTLVMIKKRSLSNGA